MERDPNQLTPPPVPPAPASESQYWIRADDHEEYGPVTLNDLKEWVLEDRAGNGTWVKKDEEGWGLWESYSELVHLLQTDGWIQASFGRRFLAFFIDYVILTLVISFAFVVAWGDMEVFQKEFSSFEEIYKHFQSPPYVEMSLYMKLIMEGAHVIYFGYFLGRPFQTLGKKIVGIRVVDAEGLPLTRLRGWMRGMASVVSLQFFWMGYWIALFNPGLRSLHDWLVQTRVVMFSKKKDEDP